MIVARSFSPPPASSFLSEKNELGLSNNASQRGLRHRSRSPQRSGSPQRSRATSSRPRKPVLLETRSDPVKIPSRGSKNVKSQNLTRHLSIPTQPTLPEDRQIQIPQVRKQSVQEILSATAIPTRRRPKTRPAQRLPAGDCVADFSKLLLEDVQAHKDVALSRSHSPSHMDSLFGNIDELVEGQVFVTGECADEGTLSARSISTDSLISLAGPDDYSSCHLDSRSSIGRSLQSRHTPRISPSVDCSSNHPLLAHLEEPDAFSLNSSEATITPRQTTPSPPTSPPQRVSKKEPSKSSFKSTLTSSLKALRTAARTTLLSTSGFGPHGGIGSSSLYTNESLLAHNFFDIQPSLTDDRRPPPTMTKPSPELRRYLNPQMTSGPPDSPTQLHFWQDERYSHDSKRGVHLNKEKSKHKTKRRQSPGPKSKIDSLPSVVPLSTCLPPTIRTANASSPPIWLTPEGEPIAKNPSNTLLYNPDNASGNGAQRHREPRENRDFLRMYVCEMAMRRSGKLSDDLSAGRARLWLPPLTGFQGPDKNVTPPRKQGAERWSSSLPDESLE